MHNYTKKITGVFILFLLCTNALFSQIGHQGIASYIPDENTNHVTTSGEAYNMHLLTGAHTSYKIGSMIKVTNIATGATANIRINDRLTAKDRELDLTWGAAKELGLLGKISSQVYIQVIEKNNTTPKKVISHSPIEEAPKENTQSHSHKYSHKDLFRLGKVYYLDGTPTTVSGYSLQICAYHNFESAQAEAKKLISYQLANIMIEPVIYKNKKTYRVLFGKFDHEDYANPVLEMLYVWKYKPFFVKTSEHNY